jgi:hypothetical protein
MALSEAQKIRLGVAVANLRRDASWQTIRQFCVAESAEVEPDYHGLSDYVMGLLGKAISDEINNGIEARRGQKP